MSDDPADAVHRSPANPDYPGDPTIWGPEVEPLDEAECLRLISAGGVGRLAYSGRLGPVVIPIGYKLSDGSIVFRTVLDSPTDEDLRTGIRGADYKVTFEVDEMDDDARAGWFVVVQGPARHMDADDDRISVWEPGARSSGRLAREHFMIITPDLVRGRRLRRTSELARLARSRAQHP